MEISILIVDDDKYLVDRIEETIQWEKIGISMVFTAYNIRQAEKLLAEFPIQLLLCDIDMPQGSGLELLEWVRSRNQRLECVFLSSYANFAYAQKALHLSTREYLLKPISNQELETVLGRIVRECLACREETPAHGAAAENAGFWTRFFLADAGREELLESAAKESGADESRLLFAVVRVCVDTRRSGYRKEIALLHQKICGLASDFFEGHGILPEETVHFRDDGWIMVFRDISGDAAETLLREWKLCLDGALVQKCFVYIGEARAMSEAERSYEILEEMERCLLPGGDGILTERALPADGAAYEQPPWEIWMKSLETPEGLGRVCGAVCGYLAESFDKGRLTLEALDRFLKEFEHFIGSCLRSCQMDFLWLFDSGEYVSKERAAFLSFDATLEFVRWAFGRLEGGVCMQDQRNVVEQVRDYIEKHLGGGLSRGLLAKEVFLSEDYLSRLFKSTMGVSLPSYIAARRMERAKEYLVHSALPVSRIALEVGYSNFSYFSKTFRDMFGVTPNEYRSQRTEK